MKSLICQNCIHADDCLFLKAMNGVVPVFCEMHETIIKPAEKLNGNHTDTSKSVIAKNIDLCSSCDHRFACNWRQEKDFVFDCEDYK
ncbi:MAG: hypothetical protein R2780_14120 [Crocinitomicaceae bacterium]